MSTVLLIGEDELLLQTRAAVLRTTGARTVCSNANSALGIQADQLCDLVILCHTLPELLCAGLAEAIHARWPRTAILLVTPTRAWESPYSDGAISAITSSEPQRLIVRAIELLSQRKSNSPNPQELPG